MGYSFQIHDDKQLVYKRVWGHYGDEDSGHVHEEWDALCRDRGVADYDELQDLTRVTAYNISLGQIHKLASHYEQLRLEQSNHPKKLAYVVPNQIAFGTGRVYGALIGLETSVNFKVFNLLEEAGKWLGLSEIELEIIAGPPRDLMSD